VGEKNIKLKIEKIDETITGKLVPWPQCKFTNNK
jgi:hypothetical protein